MVSRERNIELIQTAVTNYWLIQAKLRAKGGKCKSKQRVALYIKEHTLSLFGLMKRAGVKLRELQSSGEH